MASPFLWANRNRPPVAFSANLFAGSLLAAEAFSDPDMPAYPNSPVTARQIEECIGKARWMKQQGYITKTQYDDYVIEVFDHVRAGGKSCPPLPKPSSPMPPGAITPRYPGGSAPPPPTDRPVPGGLPQRPNPLPDWVVRPPPPENRPPSNNSRFPGGGAPWMQQLPRPREEVIAECRMRLARYTAQAERMCSIANDLKERFNNQRKSTYNQMKLCVAQMSADCRRQYRDAISRLNNANERAKQIAAAICGIRDEFYNVDCDVLAQEEQHIGGERGDGLGRLQSLLRRLEEWQAILADAENTANLWDNAIRKLLARCNCIACHPEGTGVRSRCAQ